MVVDHGTGGVVLFVAVVGRRRSVGSRQSVLFFFWGLTDRGYYGLWGYEYDTIGMGGILAYPGLFIYISVKAEIIFYGESRIHSHPKSGKKGGARIVAPKCQFCEYTRFIVHIDIMCNGEYSRKFIQVLMYDKW